MFETQCDRWIDVRIQSCFFLTSFCYSSVSIIMIINGIIIDIVYRKFTNKMIFLQFEHIIAIDFAITIEKHKFMRVFSS